MSKSISLVSYIKIKMRLLRAVASNMLLGYIDLLNFIFSYL